MMRRNDNKFRYSKELKELYFSEMHKIALEIVNKKISIKIANGTNNITTKEAFYKNY